MTTASKLYKLNPMQIRRWIESEERFAGKADGGGLYLCWPASHARPFWRFRYTLKGKARALYLGSHDDLSLAEARKMVKKLSAQVTLGGDPQGEVQAKKREAVAAIQKAKLELTVDQVFQDYYKSMILGTNPKQKTPSKKRPELTLRPYERDIKPILGKVLAKDVNVGMIRKVTDAALERGSPAMANRLRILLNSLFDHAIFMQVIPTGCNPCATIEQKHTGGASLPRERHLSAEEIREFLKAMPEQSVNRVHELAFRLLLMLGNRKMELLEAPWEEFDLSAALWKLPGERNKTKRAFDIPLPRQAVAYLQELKAIQPASKWVFVGRGGKSISRATLNSTLTGMDLKMPPFCVHSLRHTIRTQLGEEMDVEPHLCELILNHAVKIHNRHGYDHAKYTEQRRGVLQQWADRLDAIETGGNVIVMSKKVA